MSALRILMVSEDLPHPKPGGLGKHVVCLGNALIAAGHQVDLFGNNHWPYEQKIGDVAFQGRFYPALNVKHDQWKEKRLGFFIYYRRVFLARRFARAILKVADRYDVIHYHGHLPILANFIPDYVNFVQTRHDQGSDCLTHTRFRNGDVCRETDPRACAGCATTKPNAVQRILSAASVVQWRAAVQRALTSHKVIFVSQFLYENLGRTLGRLNGPGIHVVHNFVDIQALNASLAYGCKDELAPDIFMAARVDNAKGVGAFLAAAEGRLPPGRRVTIAGDGPDLTALQQRFNDSWVTFLGWMPYCDVVKLTARASVVIIPSVCEEAFGQATLEALALGRPVLALRRGGTPELQQYVQYPGQLRLEKNMESLIDTAVSTAPFYGIQDGLNISSADVHTRICTIETIYRKTN